LISRIYLHWTAGRYDQLFGDYHICIDGDGGVHRMADFETKLAHTWRRNSNAVGIALCCCYQAGITLQPTPPQPCSIKRHPSQSEGLRKVSPRQGSQEQSQSEGLRNASPLGEGDHRRWWSGFTIHWGLYPPTDMQIVSMAHCVAGICREYGLPINKETVMTHAEVADMDGYGVYDEDPDLRWDLLRLPGYGEESGGEVVRRLARCCK